MKPPKPTPVPLTPREDAIRFLTDPEKSGFFRAERLMVACYASIKEHYPHMSEDSQSRLVAAMLLSASPNATGGL